MILELLQEDDVIASYDMRFHHKTIEYTSQPFTTYHIKIDGVVVDSLMTTSKVRFGLGKGIFVIYEEPCLPKLNPWF